MTSPIARSPLPLFDTPAATPATQPAASANTAPAAQRELFTRREMSRDEREHVDRMRTESRDPSHRAGTIYSSPDGDPPNKTQRGSQAERQAEALLVAKGYRIVERNFRTKLGELDLIAHDGTTLVFVEVRSRRDSRFGSALEAVGWRKQRKVSRVASQYMAKRRTRCISVRFDVVGITGDEIVHIKDAWRLPT